jgi:hypothetical protein
MNKLSFCGESLTLSQKEIAALEARPDPAHELEPVLDCELEAHHHGPHLALGQAYGAEAEVWLQWLPGERRELVEKRDYCEAEEPDPRDPDDPWTCELPAGHPGAHSFDLHQHSGRLPLPEMQQCIQEAARQIQSDRQPSEVTDEYWINAFASGADASSHIEKVHWSRHAKRG